jgi:hypothetical protein
MAHNSQARGWATACSSRSPTAGSPPERSRVSARSQPRPGATGTPLRPSPSQSTRAVHPQAAGNLDQASVQVHITIATAKHALPGPAPELVALADGRCALRNHRPERRPASRSGSCRAFRRRQRASAGDWELIRGRTRGAASDNSNLSARKRYGSRLASSASIFLSCAIRRLPSCCSQLASIAAKAWPAAADAWRPRAVSLTMRPRRSVASGTRST